MNELRGLQPWLKLLLQQKMPALDIVVRQICQLDEKTESNADDLARIILQDASLTTKVLRVANSVHYNRSGKVIQTVSRAIIQIGFLEIKNIAIASTLIEHFMRGRPKQLLMTVLARSFHAAVQARAMVPRAQAQKREQVFIAALLRHVGELSLLVTGEAAAEAFVGEVLLHPQDQHAIAMKHLGTGIDTLNRELVKEWKLGDLIADAVAQSAPAGSLAPLINLADSISIHVSEGFASAAMQQNTQQLAECCQISEAEAEQQILLMAEEAALFASQYSAEPLVPHLPQREQILAVTAHSDEQAGTQSFLFSQQLNLLLKLPLQDDALSKLLHASINLLQEGAGIARAAVLLMDYSRKSFVPSYLAGTGTALWRQQVAVSLEQLHKGEVMYELLKQSQSCIYQHAGSSLASGVLSPLLPTGGDYLVATLRLDKRLFALLYGDAQGRSLTKRQQTEFEVVSQLLNLLLQQLEPKTE